jgi:hypothetical protein
MYENKIYQFDLYNKNKISVPAQTVLNTAVYLAVFWRYKNIVLIGADTSWHEELQVDQETNILYFDDEHFYETKQSIPSKIHEQFFCLARVFENYCLLREYADYNSVSVFNASEKSWIDAFERKKLKNILASLDSISEREKDETGRQ